MVHKLLNNLQEEINKEPLHMLDCWMRYKNLEAILLNNIK